MTSHRHSIAAVASLLWLAVTSPCAAQSAAGTRFFESKIRPALVTHCYECHSTEAGKVRGGLKVDTRDALLRGGDSGPAVVARSLDGSLLYQALLYHDDGTQMPPKGKLPQAVIDDFRQWILMGAPDPRVTEIATDVATTVDVDAGRNLWAYRPLSTDSPPQVIGADWPRTTIDRFIWPELEEQDLHPVEDAAPQVLVRRLYFVITGLPPTPEELGHWTDRLIATASDPDPATNDESDGRGRPSYGQDTVAELIDALLASPRYGERWGRHWLDVARYAESTGGDQNNIYQHAWRYRDCVIDAFNADKPFDQFIREQIAGDLLPIRDDHEWADNIVATGFLAVGMKSVGEEDQQKFFADLVDEQIDTTTRAFLATTVACARCHDHKFDPIPQEDYYALAGIFRSTETHYGLLKAQARQATSLLDLTGLGPPPGSPTLSEEEYAALVQERDDAAQAVADAMAKIRSGESVFRGTLRRLRSQRDETEAALQAYSNRGEPRVFAMGTQDRDALLPSRLLVRGELEKPAQLVQPGVLQVLTPPGQSRTTDILVRRDRDGRGRPSYRSTSGRLELAEWIARPDNPLTARVMANRVWHWMFGRGIVRTVDDFGAAGESPTHPELLDYLARRLIEENWSIKALIREIAMSRTWQLASTYDEHNFAIDPDNARLWRMSPRRLEGEAVRDAMLAASGRLDLEAPVGTYLREVGEGGVGQNVFEPDIRAIEAETRSVFLPRVRAVLPEMLATFDAPDASLVTGRREITSTPLQSLFLMNNDFVQQQAIAMAARLGELPDDQQISTAYELALNRSPTENERTLAAEYLQRFANAAPLEPAARNPVGRFGRSSSGDGPAGMRRGRGRFSSRGGDADDSEREATHAEPMTPLASFCQALLSCTEFQTID